MDFTMKILLFVFNKVEFVRYDSKIQHIYNIIMNECVVENKKFKK